MKIIKVRVWNGEQMISPDYIARGGNAYWSEDSIPCYATPDKVMLYSGLPDKDGDEICQSDILDNGQVVRFVDGCFSIGGTVALAFCNTHRKIIGNIHENPELLNSKPCQTQNDMVQQ